MYDISQAPVKKPRFVWLKLFFIVVAAFMVSILIVGVLTFIGFRYLAKRAAEQQQTYQPPGRPTNIEFAADAAAPMLGDPAAKVTIIEFADFQCPFCKVWHEVVFDKLKKEYLDTGKAKLVFQDFAFLGPESMDAGAAARCALDQGKFWEYYDALYTAQTAENIGDFTESRLLTLGISVGLLEPPFSACVKAKLGQPQVQSETDRATQAGISSTPTLLINDKVLEGIDPSQTEAYYQALSKLIDEAWESSK